MYTHVYTHVYTHRQSVIVSRSVATSRCSYHPGGPVLLYTCRGWYSCPAVGGVALIRVSESIKRVGRYDLKLALNPIPLLVTK